MLLRTGIMARLALAGLCLCAFGYSRCTFVSDTGGTGGSPIGGGSYTTTLILRDSSGTAATSFVMGEPIRFDLEIRNDANQSATLTFPDSQIYDFYVIESAVNTTRWRWSAGMVFTQVTTQLSFAPYTTRSYSVLWNGVLGNGTQLPVGSYRARGVIVAANFDNDPLMSSELGSNIVNFTVR